jgi:hypothetical protein
MIRMPLRRSLIGLVVTLTLSISADGGSLTYGIPIDTITQEGWLPEFDPMLGTLSNVRFHCRRVYRFSSLRQAPFCCLVIFAGSVFARRRRE